jgi:hypothetical protein
LTYRIGIPPPPLVELVVRDGELLAGDESEVLLDVLFAFRSF